MGFEINFIGIPEETKDADAIALRWKKSNGTQIIGVYDGGNQKYGEALGAFLDEYLLPFDKRNIDFVVCSHSDMDHSSGLKYILENYKVNKLYMNRPWLYVDDLFPYVDDGRITKNSLEDRLKEQYSYIATLEGIALKKGIPIVETFEGTVISSVMIILSPSKSFYLQLLVESSKTPLNEDSIEQKHSLFSGKSSGPIVESWYDEQLKEDVTTTPENEMSIVCLGCDCNDKPEENTFLLTGDAGIRALTNSIFFAHREGFSIKDKVDFIQIPHHGGRHNISPSLLNHLVGKIIPENASPSKTGFCSAGKNSDHPLKMVINAFTRRGVKVYKTDGNSICHHFNISFNRPGWGPIKQECFNNTVEAWED